MVVLFTRNLFTLSEKQITQKFLRYNGGKTETIAVKIGQDLAKSEMSVCSLIVACSDV